jgi:putative transposase
MIVNRIEKHIIKKSNPMWKVIDQKCLEAKNLYNLANTIVTEKFLDDGEWIRYGKMDVIMQNTIEYKSLGSQAAQNTLTLLDNNWKSYFNAIKDWSKKDGKGYFGKPYLPRNKDEKARSILMLKNIQFRIIEDKIYFSWKPFREFNNIKTKIKGKLMQVRFIRDGNRYKMEIIYETDVPEQLENNNKIIGIDLGVDNFATVVNNIGLIPFIINGRIIKSMNQYFNKEKARIMRETGMGNNNKLMNLTNKNKDKIDNFMHKASKYVINYCVENNISIIVVGRIPEWKNRVNLGRVNNQNFVCIPYEKFINQLLYKAENLGISLIIVEESYTSGTSFLDNELPIKKNYNKKRRVKRGLFESDEKFKINADVNAAYQIIKKVFPNAFEQWDRGCDSQPIRINV